MSSRRDFLAGASLAAAGMLVPYEDLVRSNAKKTRVLRIAHLTDIHVQPARRAGLGMARCLEHVHEQKDKPDVLFTGGDLIMDALVAAPDRVRTQWSLFNKVLRDFNGLPVRHCLGNHDAWPSAPKAAWPFDYGKKTACDELGLERPYYAFDQGNWRIIVLDSTMLLGDKGAYTAKLDPVQLEWLESEVGALPKDRHIMVLSHIPILTVTSYLFSESEKSGNWQVPGAWMHTDARKLKDLFYKAGNVRLCLSGHMHLNDRCDYLGTSYVTSGAVSGNWWQGRHQEADEGYSLVNLYADGTWDSEYVTYGWKAFGA